MLFAIGTKVRLKHTGDEGVITEILGGGMLNVYIAIDDMEIPVAEDDLVRTEDYKNTNHKAKIITTTPPKKIEQYEPPSIETQYAILKSQGLQLAFDPVKNLEDITTSYKIYLINDTQNEYIFSVKINLPNQIGKTTHGKIPAISTFFLQEMLFDQLNDSPNFEIETWKVTTEGTGTKQQKSLKIKPQQFFKKVKTAPLLNRPVHLYILFEKGATKLAKKREEDLKTYTQKNVRPVNLQKPTYSKYKIHDVEEYANFSGEIDLHIENLSSRKGKMTNAEKLQLQLEHFDRFMDKAIQLGVPRVFIIHGLGKGRLRDMIASRLIQMRDVKTFKNEYHPRYGWGATEVIF